jgi:hypothetical protein
MTMHLLGPEYTTTRTRKQKAKLSKKRLQNLKAEWHEHNRWLKRNHMEKISYDEFENYVRGISPEPQPKRTDTLKQSPSVHSDRMEAYKRIPSHGIKKSGGDCARRESPKYTGDLVKGIATMHKSNAVPVIDDEHAKDISKMRR